ncbi:MAG: lysozyme [Terracidiphilus sp.]
MQLSAQGLDLIKRFEGFRDHAYTDVAGLSTIGYGHRIVPPESFPNGVTEPQALALLASDVSEVERSVNRLVRVTLTQGQYDALVDFCFNLGAGRLAESTLLRELNASRYNTAAEQLLLWEHVGGKINLGLKARREADLRLWRSEVQATRTAASRQG